MSISQAACSPQLPCRHPQPRAPLAPLTPRNPTTIVISRSATIRVASSRLCSTSSYWCKSATSHKIPSRSIPYCHLWDSSIRSTGYFVTYSAFAPVSLTWLPTLSILYWSLVHVAAFAPASAHRRRRPGPCVSARLHAQHTAAPPVTERIDWHASLASRRRLCPYTACLCEGARRARLH